MVEPTPFELSLRNELDVEQHRFGNEWLFPWHSLNIEGRSLDVDRFDGGRIQLGGCRFEGQPQSIYWQAIGRYLTGKVHTVYERWDQQTPNYSVTLRRSSLEGTEKLLNGFVAKIATRAIETDQAVRGRGHPKTNIPHAATAVHSHANAEIFRLAGAHQALLGSSGRFVTFAQAAESFASNYIGIWTVLGLIAAIVFGLWAIFH